MEEEYENTEPLLQTQPYTHPKSLIYDELHHFRMSLKWCALDHSTVATKTVSYITFLTFTIVIPLLTSVSFFSTPTCGSLPLNFLAQVLESGLAVIAFLTLSSFFREHKLNQILLLDDSLLSDSSSIRRTYTREVNRAFRFLAYILFPAFLIELAHKVLFFATMEMMYTDVRPFIMAVTLASWVYRSGVFLLVCVFFRLTCELQILRFEGFQKMFEGDQGDVCVMFSEHLRIKQQLFVTSHRYRGFIIGCLVTITVSQLGALIMILSSRSRNNFCNYGDVVVCSVVKLSGFFLCLFGAARITHRAQKVVSIASRWHISLCCAAPKSKHEENQPVQLEASECRDKDLFMLSSDKRQALVMYLQHNGGNNVHTSKAQMTITTTATDSDAMANNPEHIIDEGYERSKYALVVEPPED